MRVLVTGSRTWTDRAAIRRALQTHDHELVKTLVTGACPTGADRLAEEEARALGWTIETHPADWTQGRSAGFRRNAHMVNLGANICLAFIRNSSRGATHTANLADQAGIPVRLWTA